MKNIAVSLPSKPRQAYRIYVGTNIVKDIAALFDFKAYSKIMIITDEVGAKHYLQELQAKLPLKSGAVVLPNGESSKHIESSQIIWKALLDGGFDRKSLVINLGGGVICDMGGFAAATYMRGIDFIHIPTTLLAQVDASIGGKTGINFGGIKNPIGAIYQPTGIVIDTAFLSTLPDREFISGFGEIIKQALIWDKDYLVEATSKLPGEFSPAELEAIIDRSCQIKLEVMSSDENENDQRKLLNYGHTIGHGFEAVSHESPRPLLHGEAVSIGIVAENYIAVKEGIMSAADAEIAKEALIGVSLPVSISNVNADDVLEKMNSDKKSDSGKLQFTLVDRIGHALYNQSVPDEIVAEAVSSVIQ